MGIALLFSVFAVLLLLGVPVAYALAAAALATLLYLDIPSIVLVQQISAGTGSASLIAIPLFIFAGEIMMRGGISERLIARWPGPGVDPVLAVLRRCFRFGHRRRLGGRWHHDPADGQARL